jgi:hypothetical protein
MSLFSSDSWRQSLLDLRTVAPYLFAQWLYEDPLTLEYRVGVEAGQDSFAVAHRTGIIGQVFRTGAPVLLRDVRSHPLYDPFDSSIAWECAIPFTALDGTRLVVNFEGKDDCPAGAVILVKLPQVFQQLPLRDFPASIPEQTQHLCADRQALLAACEALARAGQRVAAIGFFADLAPADHLTYQEALQKERPLAECLFPYRPGVDLFLLSEFPVQDLTPVWRLLGNGRYHVLLMNGGWIGPNQKSGGP